MAIDVEAYYRSHGPMVLRRCRSLLRDEEDAVDAMQDTFVQLVRYQGRLHAGGPSRLLYQMATNVCLNRIRSQRRHPEDPDDALLAQIAGVEEPESRHLARGVLARLFAREQVSSRTIAVLHLLDGLTLAEVADQVGMSVSGVRKRLRGVKAALAVLEGAA